MESKKYQIKTVQDMINCTNEVNLDNFLTDLKGLLAAAHTIKTIAKLVGETKGVPKELQEIESKGFTWIDNGKNDVKITIGTK